MVNKVPEDKHVFILFILNSFMYTSSQPKKHLRLHSLAPVLYRCPCDSPSDARATPILSGSSESQASDYKSMKGKILASLCPGVKYLFCLKWQAEEICLLQFHIYNS